MAAEPTEEELRAYEDEISRITSTQLVVQAAASLLNVGGRRLGLAEGTEQDRDLEQVRDAIDAVSALLPILERRMPAAQARPLRDALSQLQMAYARLAQPAQPAPGAERATEAAPPGAAPSGAPPGATPPASPGPKPAQGEDPPGAPGPAQRSGRLWVPGS